MNHCDRGVNRCDRGVNHCDRGVNHCDRGVNHCDRGRQLQKPNPNKASGPDRIKSSILKYCAKQLCSLFCVIFNQSLVQCKIPTMLVSCCFEPSQPLGVTSGLNTTSDQTLTYSAHMSFNIIHNISTAQLFHTHTHTHTCLLYTSPSPRDSGISRMPSSA